MYLSRIQLNRRRRGAWRLLSSPQRMHAAVLAAFPSPLTGVREDGARVLWRLDEEADGRLFLYVVSPDPPDFAHLAEQAGWPSVDRGTVKDYRPLLDGLDVGQRWAFRLTANPTYYVRHDSAQPAKRVAHVSAAHQEKWLVERAESAGFAIAYVDADASAPAVTVTRRSVEQFRRPPSGRPVTVSTAQFDGVLDVRDPEVLRRALVAGIGPAKAYGCGLLTLASPG